MNSGDNVEYRWLGRTGGQVSDEDAALHKAVDCGFNWLRWTSIGFEMLEKNTTVSISSLNNIQEIVGIRGATDICGTKVRLRRSRIAPTLALCRC
jgi:hypothetical protein